MEQYSKYKYFLKKCEGRIKNIYLKKEKVKNEFEIYLNDIVILVSEGFMSDKLLKKERKELTEIFSYFEIPFYYKILDYPDEILREYFYSQWYRNNRNDLKKDWKGESRLIKISNRKLNEFKETYSLRLMHVNRPSLKANSLVHSFHKSGSVKYKQECQKQFENREKFILHKKTNKILHSYMGLNYFNKPYAASIEMQQNNSISQSDVDKIIRYVFMKRVFHTLMRNYFNFNINKDFKILVSYLTKNKLDVSDCKTNIEILDRLFNYVFDGTLIFAGGFVVNILTYVKIILSLSDKSYEMYPGLFQKPKYLINNAKDYVENYIKIIDYMYTFDSLKYTDIDVDIFFVNAEDEDNRSKNIEKMNIIYMANQRAEDIHSFIIKAMKKSFPSLNMSIVKQQDIEVDKEENNSDSDKKESVDLVKQQDIEADKKEFIDSDEDSIDSDEDSTDYESIYGNTYQDVYKNTYASSSDSSINSKFKEIDEEVEVMLLNVAFYISKSSVRTRNSITICKDIQFILRLYSDIEQVLMGFDIAASSIGFDGKDFFMTPLAEISLRNRVIIPFLDQYSTSTTYRICKYAKHKNFSIYIPGVSNINKYAKAGNRGLSAIVNWYYSDNLPKKISDYEENKKIPYILQSKKIDFKLFRIEKKTSDYEDVYINSFITQREKDMIPIQIYRRDLIISGSLKSSLVSFNDVERSFPLEWKTFNPGEQFTGSFEATIYNDPSLWYDEKIPEDSQITFDQLVKLCELLYISKENQKSAYEQIVNRIIKTFSEIKDLRDQICSDVRYMRKINGKNEKEIYESIDKVLNKSSKSDIDYRNIRNTQSTITIDENKKVKSLCQLIIELKNKVKTIKHILKRFVERNSLTKYQEGMFYDSISWLFKCHRSEALSIIC